MRGLKISIAPGAYIAAAAGILLLPLNWLLSALAAAVIHEFAHFAALNCCRAAVFGIEVGLCGAKISTGPLLPGQEIICAAAGPLASLGLLIFAPWMPLLAFVGLFQGIFNLLPLYPMDGGRIARGIVCLLREKSSG